MNKDRINLDHVTPGKQFILIGVSHAGLKTDDTWTVKTVSDSRIVFHSKKDDIETHLTREEWQGLEPRSLLMQVEESFEMKLTDLHAILFYTVALMQGDDIPIPQLRELRDYFVAKWDKPTHITESEVLELLGMSYACAQQVPFFNYVCARFGHIDHIIAINTKA